MRNWVTFRLPISKAVNNPRCILEENSNVPKLQDDFITHVLGENDGTATKNLYKDFNRTKSYKLGALSQLDEFLLIPLIQGHSGTAPETTQNTLGTNQGTNEGESKCDANPEASVSQTQTIANSDPVDVYDMVTVDQEGVTYCSTRTFSGKQKKTALRSSIPQRKHSCDDGSRPIFVGSSAVGKQ